MAQNDSTSARKRRAASLATMSEQAYEAMRHRILHGELEPGTIVSERTLAEALRLGKAPIRAAVQRLASEGFMSIEPRRGIIVSAQSIQDVIDLYEVRLVLEQRVVRQITGRLQPEQIERLRANLKEHEFVAQNGQPAKTLTVDFDFHRLLCAFHGNKHLIAMLNRIYDSLFPELRLSHEKSPERVKQAVGEHRALVEAVIRGDAAEAEDLVTKHLTACQEFVLYRGARPNGAE